MLVTLFRSHRGGAVAAVVTLAAAAGLGVVNSVLVKYVFDDALFGPSGVDARLLAVLAAVMIAVAAGSALLGLVSTYTTEKLIHGVVFDLRTDLFGRLATAPLGFLRAARMGELNARFTTDLGAVQSSLATGGADLVAAAVVLLASVVAMAVLSVPLTLVTLAISPVFVWVTRAIAVRREHLAAQIQDDLGELAVVVDDALSANGALHDRLFGRATVSIAEFGTLSRVLYGKQVRQAMLAARLDAVVAVLFAVIPALVYVGAGVAATTGMPVQAGTLAAFTALQMRFFGPVGQLMRLLTDIVTALPALRRILGYAPDTPDRGTPVLTTDLGRVTLTTVSYTYPDATGRPALDEVDLDITPGTRVAVVGPSGSGKTTLAMVVAGLLTPTAGTVSAGGAVGLVTQQPHLINASVRANIVYGQADATDEQVSAAATVAGLHERITALPKGYDTVVGQNGASLSGGERQRLSLARVVLANPHVIVFDEATNALDRATEERVWSALNRQAPDRTTVTITHDMALAGKADRVVVLDRGRVTDSGAPLEDTCVGDKRSENHKPNFVEQ